MIMLFVAQQKLHNLLLFATMSPLSFCVLPYGSQYFSGLNKKENVPIKEVPTLIFVVALS